MTALISKLNILKLQNLLIEVQLSIEIAQLRKRTYNTQLQKFRHLCHKRNMSQMWHVKTLWHGQG